jgi:1,4-alpha-glucan branching enzyme
MKMKAEQGGEAFVKEHRENVQFKLAAQPGSEVSVAGTFNNWNPAANPLVQYPEGGVFKTAMQIPKGTYEYVFVVNGVWAEDPGCAERSPTMFGSMNSVLHV